MKLVVQLVEQLVEQLVKQLVVQLVELLVELLVVQQQLVLTLVLGRQNINDRVQRVQDIYQHSCSHID